MLLGPVVKGYASGGCFGGLGTSHPPPERDFRLWEDVKLRSDFGDCIRALGESTSRVMRRLAAADASSDQEG